MRILAKEPHQRPASAEAMSQELARAMNLSSTTSGVRVSVSGSTPPPAGVISIPQLPPMGGAPNFGIPPAPMSDGYLSNLPSSTESLQIAAGVGRRSRKKTVLGAVGAMIALAVLAAVVLGTRAPPPRAPIVTREPTPESAIPPVPPATAALASAAPAATGTGRVIPEANVADLPRARGNTPPPAPPSRHEPTHSRPQQPTPATSASGHYGLFE
jgi:hypothetical protein